MAKGRKGVSPTETAETPRNGAPPVARASDDIVETVRGLAAVVAEHALSELVVELEGRTITLRRGAPVVMPSVAAMAPMAPMTMPPMSAMPTPMPTPMPAMPTPMPMSAATPAPAPQEDSAHVVTSPFVGTFYRRPNPDSPEYVRINDRVEKGQVLCIVEAMKLMNEIEADVAGTILAVLAEDGAPVEYGQPLFKIAPG